MNERVLLNALRREQRVYCHEFAFEVSLSWKLLSFLGYDNRNYAITGLLNYWKYNITVQVSAPLGPSEPEQIINQTASSGE